MSVHPQRLKRIGAFVRIAFEEVTAARVLVKTHPRQASFFAQQGVEKLLRAVIEAEDRVAGPTHNLRELTGLLPLENSLRDQFIMHQDLSAAATRYRYPLGGGGVAEPEPVATLIEELDGIERLQKQVVHFLSDRNLLPKN